MIPPTIWKCILYIDHIMNIRFYTSYIPLRSQSLWDFYKFKRYHSFYLFLSINSIILFTNDAYLSLFSINKPAFDLCRMHEYISWPNIKEFCIPQNRKLDTRFHMSTISFAKIKFIYKQKEYKMHEIDINQTKNKKRWI